jgi:ribonuclease G
MTGFSDFGLVEMTRKRVRMSLTHAIFRTCPYCEGVGKILGEAQIWKTLKYALLKELSQGEKGGGVEIAVHSHIRSYLEREVIAELSAIAARFGIQLKIVGKAEFHHEQFEIVRSINSSNDKDKEAASARRRSPVKKENKGLASDPLATG